MVSNIQEVILMCDNATSEGLVWHSPFEQFPWTSVDHVNGDGECFDPEAVLHPGMMEECSNS